MTDAITGNNRSGSGAAAALQGTFHRRQLPPPAVAFSSMEGRAIFTKALQSGYLNAYFRLSETYTTQGSLSMALNALLVDPHRVWQGVWRWFDESMLDCCQPLDVTRLKGLTLDSLACLAHCNAAKVTLKYGPSVTEEEFRADIIAATSVGPDNESGISATFTVMIVAYNRQKLRQSGTGHYSPIGGYEEESDKVLIMDVARFKYPPHWVPLKDLYLALQDIDPDSQKPRGYLLLQASEDMLDRCSVCTTTATSETTESDIAAEVVVKPSDSTTNTIMTALTNTIENKIQTVLDTQVTEPILRNIDCINCQNKCG